MLNVNWENIHSIILSVTCHGLRNFAPAHTHPLTSMIHFLCTVRNRGCNYLISH